MVPAAPIERLEQPTTAAASKAVIKRPRCQVLGLEDFTKDDIAALEAARAPEAAKAFNPELKPR